MQPPLFLPIIFSILTAAHYFCLGEVTVVALAPLTNLALAMRLDSTVGRKIKDLYIMGGNIEGWLNSDLNEGDRVALSMSRLRPLDNL